MPIKHRNLPETINIQRVAETNVDERGLPSDSWSNNSTNIRAKLESQGQEEDRDGRNTTVETFVIYVPGDTDVVAGDRIVHGSDNHEIIIITPVKDRYGNVCYKQIQSYVRT
tara:strand:+ start:3810 stop:4145 length:336 start_codon:yes stop_codon:yes gene_type:complete